MINASDQLRSSLPMVDISLMILRDPGGTRRSAILPASRESCDRLEGVATSPVQWPVRSVTSGVPTTLLVGPNERGGVLPQAGPLYGSSLPSGVPPWTRTHQIRHPHRIRCASFRRRPMIVRLSVGRSST